MTHTLYPCIWFDGQAKAAATYYCGIFKNATILDENPMVVMFELNGSKFMALNGGPLFPQTEAVSFVIPCDTQEEIDYYWNSLTAEGGQESQCGWLKDKFGVSWQVVPAHLGKLMADPARAGRVMQEIMKMKKLDIATLENA